MNKPTIEEIREALRITHAYASNDPTGQTRAYMTIPVQPDDPDVMLWDAIEELESLRGEVERLQELAAAVADYVHARGGTYKAITARYDRVKVALHAIERAALGSQPTTQGPEEAEDCGVLHGTRRCTCSTQEETP